MHLCATWKRESIPWTRLRVRTRPLGSDVEFIEEMLFENGDEMDDINSILKLVSRLCVRLQKRDMDLWTRRNLLNETIIELQQFVAATVQGLELKQK